MRVCITGSHSTGKSTLVRDCHCRLARLFPNGVDLLPETARLLIASGLPVAKETNCEMAITYVRTQLQLERAAVREHVIADRSVLDLLTYLRANSSPLTPGYLVNMVEEIVWAESRYFDMYCFVPIEFPMVSDDARPDDEAYRAEIGHGILEALKEFRLPYRIVSGSPTERVSQVLASFPVADLGSGSQ